jgi:hypothetical protein
MTTDIYRGVAYDLTKVGSQWDAAIAWADGRLYRTRERTRNAALGNIKRVIDIRLDWDGDADLYGLAHHIVDRLTAPRFSGPLLAPQQIENTRKQMLHRLDRAYEYVKRAIEVLPADTDALVEKLQRMTVENGCTPAEAEAAAQKLRQLRVVKG